MAYLTGHNVGTSSIDLAASFTVGRRHLVERRQGLPGSVDS
jgi:hypothetical protein